MSTRSRHRRNGAGHGPPPARSSGPHGWVALRRLVLAVCLPLAMLLLLASAPVAEAVERRANDREARIRFTLDGRALAVRVLSRAPRSVRRELFGNRIRAVCGTNFAFDRGVGSGARGCGR